MRRYSKISPLNYLQISISKLLAGLGTFSLLVVSLSASSSAQQRLFASPKFEGGNRFAPSEFDDVELPVALGGFCPVTLRDQHEWIAGKQQLLVVFDGQIYWFAGERERAIFAASPTDYAPVLGGGCVVTLADTGERTLGKLECAIEHAGRLYMFASELHREQFQDNPDAYMHSDLANNGYCLVSQVDEDRKVAGMPETTVMIDGLRYMFAGDFHRRKFAANIHRYGVERHLLMRPAGTQEMSAQSGSSTKSEAKPLNEEPAKAEPEVKFVMDGYCPVTIQQRNIWVRGVFQYRFEYQGKMYLMAGDAEKNRFMLSPEKFAPAMGGDCIVSKIDDGLEVPGSIYHAVFDSDNNRMFLFAGAEQKAAFSKDSERYKKLAKLSANSTGQGDPLASEETPALGAQKKAQAAQ